MANNTYGVPPGDRDNAYTLRLRTPDNDIFYGEMPDHLNLEISAPWDSPAGLGDLVQSGINNLFGRKGAGANFALQRSVGRVEISRYATGLEWQGKEYLNLAVPFHFYARKNAQREITEVTKVLMQFAAPVEGLGGAFLLPPGQSAVNAARSAVTQEFSGFVLMMGNFAVFDELVVTSVVPELQLRIDRATKHPMEALINVQLKTRYAVTSQYLERAFSRGAPAIGQQQGAAVYHGR